MSSGFRKMIEDAINTHSMENGSNTPDFMLAEYLIDCLAAFDKAVSTREAWYGRGPVVATEVTPDVPGKMLPRIGGLIVE